MATWRWLPSVSPKGRRAATCGEDKTLKIWDLPDLGK
jgi:WD40 repeat protein